jgi:hypothetical protein
LILNIDQAFAFAIGDSGGKCSKKREEKVHKMKMLRITLTLIALAKIWLLSRLLTYIKWKTFEEV